MWRLFLYPLETFARKVEYPKATKEKAERLNYIKNEKLLSVKYKDNRRKRLQYV